MAEFNKSQYLYLLLKVKGKHPGFISHKEIFDLVMD